MRKKLLFLLISFSLISYFCGPSVYYIKPPDWSLQAKRDSTIRLYSQYLKDWKFFLDPGHGGNDRFNMGPAKDAIEADINLKVALTLSEYLQNAGAKIFMSRRTDTTVNLPDRSKLSNSSGADIFISIHHNALSNNDHFTNYTSTWYHAHEDDIDYHPCNHDIAKYVQRDLGYVMGNNGPLASFDGTLSDYLVYPNSGFSVLRNANIPSILIECSFFSSFYEEQRLRIPEFNEIEAWGIFRGLGKYLKAGIPTLELSGETFYQVYKPEIKIRAIDKFGIDPSSITVRIDSQVMNSEFERSSNIIKFVPSEDLSNGEHLLEVIVRNRNGNHSFPFKKIITIATPPGSLEMDIFPKVIPPEEEAVAKVFVTVKDKKGNPVANGTRIQFFTSLGQINYSANTSNGIAKAYIKAPKHEGIGIITAKSDGVSISDTITYSYSNNKYITGIIKDREDSPIKDCRIIPVGIEPIPFSFSNYLKTDDDGKYIINGPFGDTITFNILKDGYFGKSKILPLESKVNYNNISLDKIVNGCLFDKWYVIDPRYGGIEKGEIVNGINSSKINLEIAQYLFKLLKASGANVILTRDSDITLPEEKRANLTKNIKRGFYIRLDVSGKDKLSITQYPNIPNTEFSNILLSNLNQITQIKIDQIYPSRENIFSWSGINTVSINLPSLNSQYFRSDNIKFLESQIAWGIYNGIVMHAGFNEDQGRLVKYEIFSDGKPAIGKEAILDNALISVSNNHGEIFFYNITGGDSELTVFSEGDYNIIK
jgi:N-acetylmuramoyl-L-alanine amidase